MSQSFCQFGKPMGHVFFFFFLLVSKSVKFALIITFVQCEIWNLMFGWTRNKTKINPRREFKKFSVQCVLLCLSYILTKKKKKKKRGGGIKSLNFAESNTQRKTNAHCSFETHRCFCFVLFCFSSLIELFSWKRFWVQNVSIFLYFSGQTSTRKSLYLGKKVL